MQPSNVRQIIHESSAGCFELHAEVDGIVGLKLCLIKDNKRDAGDQYFSLRKTFHASVLRRRASREKFSLC